MTILTSLFAAMGPKKTNNGNGQYNDLLRRLQEAEKTIKDLQEDKVALVKRVEKLETNLEVSRNVSTKLRAEIDRVGQYQRRSNVVIKYADLPKENNEEKDKTFVKNVFEKELKLQNVVSQIDKVHRIGKKFDGHDGTKSQDIIVRFKNHNSRYAVMNKRKDAKSVKIRPNLTKFRNNLLFNANEYVKNNAKIDFCFANIHGDLNVRLKEKIDDRQTFSFDSMKGLETLLKNKGIVVVEGGDEVVEEDEMGE